MGMLLRRHYADNTNTNMAEGATNKVAPKPTPIEVKEDKPEEKKITRQDIQKMNVATVRAYAESQGIEDVNEKSGAELKRILFDKMFDESESESESESE